MPIGVTGQGADFSGGGISRPWEDDGSVPLDLYVNNLIGDDDSFDGSAPAIGAGNIGPFATIKRAIDETPIVAQLSRTIYIAGTGTKYTIDSCVLKAMNKLTFVGDTSIESSETISSINSSARSIGLDLTIGAGMTIDTHRGKLVDFTSGSMSAGFGWIYSNDATDVQVAQDTPGSLSFSVPAVSDTFDILSLDTEVEILGPVIMTDSAGGCDWKHIHFTGTGHINTISTDQINFQYCRLDYERHQVGGFGRTLLLCSYLATTGNAIHGLLGVLNQAHVFLNRGTVVDGGLNAGANNHVRSVSQSSWETDSEVVFKDVGEIRWRGTQVMARNAIQPGEHTWRFVDCDGVVGNDDNEASWGHWDLPVCYGSVTGSYFLTGTRGVWGRIASGSSVTTTTVTNAVSADDGATASADHADYTHFEGGDPAGIGNPMAPSSIEGVSSYGGNIDLVPVAPIIITGDDPTDTIIIDVDSATETAEGVIEIATAAEVAARTDDVRAITPLKHETADSLVHSLAETSYEELTRVSGQVSNVTIWTDSGKSVKVRETDITRSSGQVSVIIDKQYDAVGVLAQTMTGTITRSGGQVASIDWVES